jgi:hypothetical protein
VQSCRSWSARTLRAGTPAAAAAPAVTSPAFKNNRLDSFTDTETSIYSHAIYGRTLNVIDLSGFNRDRTYWYYFFSISMAIPMRFPANNPLKLMTLDGH